MVFTSFSGFFPFSERYLRLLYSESVRNDLPQTDLRAREKCICILGEKTNSFFQKNAARISRRFGIRESFVLSDARHYVLMQRPAEISNIIWNYARATGNGSA